MMALSETSKTRVYCYQLQELWFSEGILCPLFNELELGIIF